MSEPSEMIAADELRVDATLGARRRMSAWHALLTSPTGLAALVVDVIIIALAIFAPIIWGDAADTADTNALSQGPGAGHLFGTDSLGRDILLRVLVATRLSMTLALGTTLIGVGIGVLIGASPTILGRRAGRIVTAGVNVAVSFPGLLLALFFAIIFGVGAVGAMFALGVAFAPAFARLTQTLAAAVDGRDFIAAARVVGVGRARVLLRHVIPNIAEPLVINTTQAAGGALLAFASLSFLGIGVQPPTYDWGRMLGDGVNDIYTNPLAALAPGIAVVLAGLALNLTGEAAAAAITGRGTVRRIRGRGVMASTSEGAVPSALLDVRALTVTLPTRRGPITPVRGIDLTLARGEAVGIVGESGSGKSLTALAISRLIEYPGIVAAARLDFLGRDLRGDISGDLRKLMGTSMAVVFQDPMSSLNPAMKVGRQLSEIAEVHQGASRRSAAARAVDRLRAVRIPAAQRRARQYPYEFSGGMRQRAMIAMGLMGTPALLIADEPTTALDVTVQRDVLELIAKVRADENSALLLISHDIAVVAGVCDRVLVMYAGKIVEDLPVGQLLSGPAHPYTRALIATVPGMDVALDAELPTIAGRPPDPSAFPVGCAFAARCSFATNRCRAQDPALDDRGLGHAAACWHPQSGPVDRSRTSTPTGTDERA